MNVLVYLENDVDAFRVTDELVNGLHSRFPGWQFIRTSVEERFLENLPDAEIVVTWEFRAQWYKTAAKLRAICTPAAGHDWIERPDDLSMPVFYGTFHGPVMAESLVAMILHFNRGIPQCISQQKDHLWDRAFLSRIRRLGSQHVIIAGYGKIARECSRVLKTFGCRITGVKHSPYDPWLDKDADAICHPSQLKTILGNCDHLVSILPGTESNDRFFSKDLFSSIKPGALFYNIGRGNCCTGEDILWALQNGFLAGAGLDVFYHEPLPETSALWDHPNVLVMPHGSAIVHDYMSMYFDELAEVLKAFAD